MNTRHPLLSCATIVTDTASRKRDFVGHYCLCCEGTYGEDGLDPINFISCTSCGDTVERYLTKAEWIHLQLETEEDDDNPIS